MNLEHFIVTDQLSDHFINAIVQLDKLFFLIVLFIKDRFDLLRSHFQVLLHVEQQLKQQLADTQILAYHLFHLKWVDILQVRLLGTAAFQKLLDFLYLLGDLHHSEISDFLLALLRTPFKIFSQINNLRVER